MAIPSPRGERARDFRRLGRRRKEFAAAKARRGPRERARPSQWWIPVPIPFAERARDLRCLGSIERIRGIRNPEKDLRTQRPPGRPNGDEGANAQPVQAERPRERARPSHWCRLSHCSPDRGRLIPEFLSRFASLQPLPLLGESQAPDEAQLKTISLLDMPKLHIPVEKPINQRDVISCPNHRSIEHQQKRSPFLVLHIRELLSRCSTQHVQCDRHKHPRRPRKQMRNKPLLLFLDLGAIALSLLSLHTPNPHDVPFR